MNSPFEIRARGIGKATALLLASLLPIGVHAASRVEGHVVDLNGRPLDQAMVTLGKEPTQSGPTAITVFTDENGQFQFPNAYEAVAPTAKSLGYRMVDAVSRPTPGAVDVTIIMRAEANQAGIAPASAWLKDITDPTDKSALVVTCVECHQMPAPEVRTYANMMRDVPNANLQEVREQSWHAIVKYMNYLAGWEFSRGKSGGEEPLNAARAYSSSFVGPEGPTAALVLRTLAGPLQEIEGYRYRAPLLVNAHTVIREYEIPQVPRPNAMHDAVTLEDSNYIWLGDISANRLIRVDTTTGGLRSFEIPSERIMGPHTLVRDKHGVLWATPFFNGIIARFDSKTELWKTWQLHTEDGGAPHVHDLAIDSDHDLSTDRHGRIWYSDIQRNAVGWFDPITGKSANYPIPPAPGRVGNEQAYGIVMTSDRTHIWYSQLHTGRFGSFNIETLNFETTVQLPGDDRNVGPRRMAISERGILYVALYGAGQLAEYDTRKRQMIGVYDLPDRASAPYSVTWDPKRKVVWIPTANANLIYRFDPRDKSFGVLPLPREGAFLRMVDIDERTGALVTTYANVVEHVHGPRMAVMIDVGDSPANKGTQSAGAVGSSTAK